MTQEKAKASYSYWHWRNLPVLLLQGYALVAIVCIYTDHLSWFLKDFSLFFNLFGVFVCLLIGLLLWRRRDRAAWAYFLFMGLFLFPMFVWHSKTLTRFWRILSRALF